MKNIFVSLLVLLILCSCDRESIKISGKISGIDNANIELSLKTKGGDEKVLLDEIKTEAGTFDAYLENEKPPFKLTVIIDSLRQVDFWVFKYGKFNFELDANELDIKINDSFENSELKRVNKTYDNMYLKPLKEQIDWVAKYNELEHNEADQEKLERYKKQIKKAYKLRRKSILKTVRKAPQNPIAMALFFDEFENLTSWQKKECLKLVQKYYSDAGVSWQLKH